MKEFRVTKFDPAKRDLDGVYSDQDEWTSAADIGKSLNGSVLTLEDYLDIETCYVNAVLRYFATSDLPHLRITGFRNEDESEAINDLPPNLRNPEWSTVFREDQAIGIELIPQLVRQNLRGILTCRLEFDGKFFVHFGWDFYMYLGTCSACGKANVQTESDGLFVEECSSPYGRPVGFIQPNKILVSDKLLDRIEVDDQSIPYVGSELIVEQFHWTRLRDIMGYSREHPFFGFFDINEVVVKKLNDELGLNLDSDRFEYTLDTTGS